MLFVAAWVFWWVDNTWQNVTGGATTVAALLTDVLLEYAMPIELRS
jgi:hypothetical protein